MNIESEAIRGIIRPLLVDMSVGDPVALRKTDTDGILVGAHVRLVIGGDIGITLKDGSKFRVSIKADSTICNRH